MKNCTISMSGLDFIQVAQNFVFKNLNFKPKNHQFTILPHFLKIDVTSEPLDKFS